ASLSSSNVRSHRTLRKRCMSQPWSDNHPLLQPETTPQHYGERTALPSTIANCSIPGR
ncbi:unnamed protein product, partial [Brassica rapa subsp. trilocularis]